MNKVILIGRLTRDPDVRRTQDGKAVARYTLAVDRRGKDNSADFISCVAWEKRGEFAEQYLRKGTKIAVTGHIQTGEYTNRNGQKVYTTDVIVEEHEFCERRQQEAPQTVPEIIPPSADDFIDIPDDIAKELPFG